MENINNLEIDQKKEIINEIIKDNKNYIYKNDQKIIYDDLSVP